MDRHIGIPVMAALVACVGSVPGGALAAQSRRGNPAKVKLVEAGTLTEARADWWGFDATDATKHLQAAIDSGARKVIVPDMGSPWIVHPIKLASDQGIVLERGVVIEAIRGGFKGRDDNLMSARSQKSISIRGTDATLRMHKKDYHDSTKYQRSEWRHALAFRSCENVHVQGLTIASSGGDGIYIGDCRKPVNYCKDVVIKDCLIDDNNRQGISVISVVNLLVEDCVIQRTRGTAPQSGIDFEPNSKGERLYNITIRNCIIKDNASAGIILCAHPHEDSDPISFVFDRCALVNNRFSGGFGARPPFDKIDVTMIDCTETRKGRTRTLTDFWRDWQNMKVLSERDRQIVEATKRVPLGDLELKPVDEAAYADTRRLSLPRLRRTAHYVMQLKQGEQVRMSATLLRDYGKGMSIEVTAPSGSSAWSGSVRGKNATREIAFEAADAGLYRILFEPGPGWFDLDSGGRSTAACAASGPIQFFGHSALGEYYFYVPEGVRDFYAEVSGQGNERVKATLYDASGAEVETRDQISVAHAFVVRRDDATAGEIWRLHLERPSEFGLEDYAVDLFGVPPILASDKASLLMPVRKPEAAAATVALREQEEPAPAAAEPAPAPAVTKAAPRAREGDETPKGTQGDRDAASDGAMLPWLAGAAAVGIAVVAILLTRKRSRRGTPRRRRQSRA